MTTVRRQRGLATALVASTIASLSLSACSEQPEPPDCRGEPRSVVIAAGGHLNSPVPQLAGRALERLAQAVDSCGAIGVARIDGNPSFVAWLEQAEKVKKKKTEDSRQAAIDTYIAEVAGIVAGINAEEPEAAPLEALEVAARNFDGVAADHDRTIIVVDSGLQTTAPFSFVDQFSIASDPQEAVEYLANTARDLPDLSGVEVVWLGIGRTSPPQPELSEGQRSDLESIWRAVIERAGGTVEFTDTSSDAEPTGDLPYVSVVPLAEPPPAGPTCAPVMFRDDTVKFIAEEATFLRPGEVAALLRGWAERIKAESLSAHLIGTTATGESKQRAQKLSEARAAAVRDVLVSQGVNPAKITTEGLGWWDEWHLVDIDGSDLVPATATQNRKVVIQLSGATCA